MKPPIMSLVTALTPGLDVTVLGLADSAGSPVTVGAPEALAAEVAKRYGAPLEVLATRVGASTKPGSTAVLPGPSGLLVLTALGDADVTPDRVRRAAALGVRRALEASGDKSVTIGVSLDTNDPEVLSAAAEGALLGAYRYSKPGSASRGVGVQHRHRRSGPRPTLATARQRPRPSGWPATVNTPPNVLYPETFAESARNELKGSGRRRCLTRKRWRRAVGGILTVGGGRPDRAWSRLLGCAGRRRTVLVGKADSRQRRPHLKPAEGMINMKCDMGGRPPSSRPSRPSRSWGSR